MKSPSLEELLERYSSKEKVKIRMGIRPSGMPHLGTIQVINTCFLLGNMFLEQGQHASVDFTFADIQQPTNSRAYGTPLKYTPAPENRSLSKADYYASSIGWYIKQVHDFIGNHLGNSVSYSVYRDSEFQTHREYRQLLSELLKHIEEQDPGPYSFDFFSTNIVCPECKKHLRQDTQRELCIRTAKTMELFR